MPKTIIASVLAEQQQAENEPIFLLEMELPSGTVYYCDRPEAITFPSSGGNSYSPLAFEFGDINATITDEVDRVEFSLDNVDRTFTVLQQTTEMPGSIVKLKRVFGNQLNSSSNAIILFWGWIGPVDIDQYKFRMEVLSPSVALDRPFPPRLYGPNCPWVFGGTECGASTGQLALQSADYGSTAAVILDAARTEDNDYWRDGSILFTSGNLAGEKRKIGSNVSGAITLVVAFDSVPSVGDLYTITRGCDKTDVTCSGRFSNYTNFGGMTGIPGLELENAS